ncbi:MAG: hypothetical protein ACO1SV_21580 [Fimbriimonas sp.]
MVRTRLETASGDVVAHVLIPPFNPPAESVSWEHRLFFLRKDATEPTYREGLLYVVTKEAKEEVAPPPVDRSAVATTDGTPYDPSNPNGKTGPDGQHERYVVLSDEERAKGFVRPVRDAYIHEKCGKVTAMGRTIAETYARDPKFYNATYCSTCRAHFPVGENGEFYWYPSDDLKSERGPKVGT